MADILTCRCGKQLDIEGFEPGQQVECPSCHTVLTVPASTEPEQEQEQEPQVAMAAAVDDEPAGRGKAQGPMARRRMADRRRTYAAQAKLKRVMTWPALVLGFLSIVVAGLGFYWEFVAEKTIEIEKDDRNVARLYARVGKQGAEDEYERIEVQPDILPGDKVYYDADDNPVITLYGNELKYRNGILHVTVDGELTPVQRRGLWFYEVKAGSDKKPPPLVLGPDGEAKRLDLPLVAQRKSTMRYVPVTVEDTQFRHAETGAPIEVAYYRAEDRYATDPIQSLKYSGPPLGLPPVFFIIAGLPIGILLLLSGAFFLYETYFSSAAKAARAQSEQES